MIFSLALTNSSALEHAVPEQLFSTPTNPAQGLSAVKALKIANDQGIPIYTINQSNINTILPQLQLSVDVKTDIQNAVNTGKEVTVSKTNISFNGWTGCGYMIIDPNTGNGAYRISGGANGGILLTILLLVTAFLIIGIAVAILVAGSPIIAVIALILLPFLLIFQTWLATQASKEFKECVIAVAISILTAILLRNLLLVVPYKYIVTVINTIRVYFSGTYTGMKCFGIGTAE